MSNQASLGDISSSGSSDSTDESEKTDLKNNPQLNLGPFTLQVPKNWSITQFNQDIDLVNGVNYESKHYCEEGEGRIFLTLNAVKKGGGFKQDGIKHYGGPVDEEKILSPGDLLIANTDLTQEGEVVGYPFQVPEFSEDEREIVPSMDLSIMDLKNEKFNKTFLQYLFRTNYIHSRLRSFSAGSTVLHLNTDLTENMDLPVPPKDEQRRIASVLYNVDQAISKTEEIIEQTQRVKKGLMQDLFTEGYYSHEEFEDSPIGKVPADWKVENLENHIELISGAHVKSDLVSDDSSLTPYITGPEDFENEGFSVTKFTDEPTKFCEPGDVLVTVKGSGCGKSTLADQRACISRQLKALRVEDGLNEKFLFNFVRHKQNLLKTLAEGSAIPGLSNSHINKMKVPVPKPEEQEKIADAFENLDEKIKNQKNEKEQLQRLKKGLMQDLLAGEIRTHESIKVLDEVIEVEG